MKGMSINEFMNKIYYGDELEFVINETTYFIQGFQDNAKFTLIVDYWNKIDGTEPEHDYLFSITCTSKEERMLRFEKAPIFNGKTIYE